MDAGLSEVEQKALDACRKYFGEEYSIKHHIEDRKMFIECYKMGGSSSPEGIVIFDGGKFLDTVGKRELLDAVRNNDPRFATYIAREVDNLSKITSKS